MIGNDMAHETNIIVQCRELAVAQMRAEPVRNKLQVRVQAEIAAHIAE